MAGRVEWGGISREEWPWRPTLSTNSEDIINDLDLDLDLATGCGPTFKTVKPQNPEPQNPEPKP